MFVKRDAEGSVCAVSVKPEGEISELIADDSPELVMFLANNKPQAHQFLERSDLIMARVMEDAVNLLIDKGIIQFTELPPAAQEKMLSREKVRSNIQDVGLLDDDENIAL